jgi:hypothetical protein
MLKYLRIGVTALCLTACALLIGLWVRSYRDQDGFARALGIAWASQDGALSLVYPEDFAADPNEEEVFVSYMMPKSEPVAIDWTVDSFGFRFTGSWSIWIVTMSYAYPVVFFGTLAFAPWLRLSFSLRTLFIATTLVAVGLGLIVLSKWS